MPLIPLPSTSYPVDTNLIYEVIRGINVLSDAVAKSAGTSYLNGSTVPSNAVQIVTKTIQVVNNQNITAGETKSFDIDYADFAEIPIITTSLTVPGANFVSKNLSVILTSVTTTKASGFVRFGEGGVTTVSVNLLIAGVSQTYKR